jgi:hydroxypyruvate isomerase
MLADGLLYLHLRFSSNVDARLKNDLSEQAAKGETSITLITGLQHNAHNILAQAERQAEVDGINELGLLQNQVTAPDNCP